MEALTKILILWAAGTIFTFKAVIIMASSIVFSPCVQCLPFPLFRLIHF